MSKHKKKKLLKMKDKYSEQTAEERDARLRLLGAKKVQGVDFNKFDKEFDAKTDDMEVEESEEQTEAMT